MVHKLGSPAPGDVRVSGRANTPSWVYRRRLTGRLWNTTSHHHRVVVCCCSQVRAAVDCENQLTAVERLWEYISQLPAEQPHALPSDPPASQVRVCSVCELNFGGTINASA